MAPYMLLGERANCVKHFEGSMRFEKLNMNPDHLQLNRGAANKEELVRSNNKKKQTKEGDIQEAWKE